MNLKEFGKWDKFKCLKCGKVLAKVSRSIVHIDKMREVDIIYCCANCKTDYLLEVYDTPKLSEVEKARKVHEKTQSGLDGLVEHQTPDIRLSGEES